MCAHVCARAYSILCRAKIGKLTASSVGESQISSADFRRTEINFTSSQLALLYTKHVKLNLYSTIHGGHGQ